MARRAAPRAPATRRHRPHRHPARIGIPAELDIMLVFGVVTGTLAAVLGEAAYARVRDRRWPWRRRPPQRCVTIDPAHRAALHATCRAHAKELRDDTRNTFTEQL